LNDYGRQVDLKRRYDDFAKLHEGVSSIPGVILPPMPPKQLFGGNDPKVVEGRRPALETILKECLANEKVLSDPNGHIYKFLDISEQGQILTYFLSPLTRDEYVSKLPELLKPDNTPESYRLFNESVMRTLLHVIQQFPKEDPSILKPIITVMDILQFTLTKAHTNPLANTVDVQSIFVTLKGFQSVWQLLITTPGLRENCRKVLSSLISSNYATIQKFEKLFLVFIKDQNGLSILFDSLTDENDTSGVHEIIAKLFWFGLSSEVQMYIANHPQGLALLGKLFGSSDVNARCLSGLTLSVLISGNMIMDQSKSTRAIDGVTSILSSLISSSTNLLPTTQFLSAVCRGSSNGLERIKKCMHSGNSPMNDFCAWILQNAELPIEFIRMNELLSLMESAVLNHPSETVIAISASRFLYRLYNDHGVLPSARDDNKIGDLFKKVQLGMQNYHSQSRKIIQSEYSQYSQFQNFGIEKNFRRIEKKNSQIEFLDFAILETRVKEYQGKFIELDKRVGVNNTLIKLLGESTVATVGGVEDSTWTITSPDLVKEWNQSQLGMELVNNRLEQLRTALKQQESQSKAAENDSAKLQQVISNMRNEIVIVDSKAEEYRKESSRFTSASSGAVDASEMLRRTAEFEEKAKEEILKREALRQSQDSLEAQLAQYRSIIVQAESEAAETRKAIIETTNAAENGVASHNALEKQLREEMGKMLTNWTSKLQRNKKAADIVSEIHGNCDAINKLIGTENEEKDLISNLITEMISKLQKLQTNINS